MFIIINYDKINFREVIFPLQKNWFNEGIKVVVINIQVTLNVYSSIYPMSKPLKVS